MGDLIYLVIVIAAIGGISWYRYGKRTVRERHQSPEDLRVAKEFVRVGLEVLGYAAEPSKAATPSDAQKYGIRSVEDNGISHAIVVYALGAGLASNYAQSKGLDQSRAGALLLSICELIAGLSGLDQAEIWDRGGSLLQQTGPLGFLFQQAGESGFSICTEALMSDVFKGIVLDAAEQAKR